MCSTKRCPTCDGIGTLPSARFRLRQCPSCFGAGVLYESSLAQERVYGNHYDNTARQLSRSIKHDGDVVKGA